MQSRLLRHFLAVVERKNITAAADDRHHLVLAGLARASGVQARGDPSGRAGIARVERAIRPDEGFESVAAARGSGQGDRPHRGEGCHARAGTRASRFEPAARLPVVAACSIARLRSSRPAGSNS